MWNCEVKVFGRKVRPGQLIHADKHGFLVIPDEDQDKLLEATRFMDSNECKTMISAARNSTGKRTGQIIAGFEKAVAEFKRSAGAKHRGRGEY